MTDITTTANPNDRPSPGRRRPMTLGELRDIAVRVLSHRGITVADARPLDRDESMRLETVGTGKMRDTRQVVYLEAKPLHGRVSHHVVDALAEDVAASDATAGILFTPYHVDRSTAPDASVPLELVDGLALVRLVDHFEPNLKPTLERYRLVGSEPA